MAAPTPTLRTLAALLTPALLITPASALLGGCAGDAPAGPEPFVATQAGGIAGGYTSTEDTAVIGIVAFGLGGLGICSGTLISPNVVLTARHCVAPVVNEAATGGVDCSQTGFGPTYEPQYLYVTTRPQISQDPNAYHTVKYVLAPPFSEKFCGYDVALMVLDEPVDPSEAVPLTPRVDVGVDAEVAGPVPQGEEYSAIGFGNVDDFQGSGVRRRRDGLNAFCVGFGCGAWGSVTESEWIGQSSVCQGDSGGPAVDMQGRVIGVASRGGQGCSYPVYAHVWWWADWISEIVANQAEAAGLEVPQWTQGWPTDPAYGFEVGAPCTGDDACPSGMCVAGYCSRACMEDAPCPSGFHCRPDTGLCEVAVVGVSCEDDTGCPGGACLDGLCTRHCEGGAIACPSGWTCASATDLCELVPVGVPCAGDGACLGSGAVCLEGICTRGCGAEAPCPAGYGCADSGMCELLAMGTPCAADGDCAGGLCDVDLGLCSRACDDELAPCEPGWSCDADSGACLLTPAGDACVDDSTCTGDSACVSGICTRPCEAVSAPCPSGLVCGASGMCGVPDDDGCAAGDTPTSRGTAWIVLLAGAAMLAARGRRRSQA